MTEPHDLPLQALAETGVVGFLFAAGAVLAAVLAVGGAVRRLAGEERAAGLALAVVALLYPLHGLVDYDWDFVAVSAPFFFTLGVLLAAGAPTRIVRRPLFALAGGLIAVAAWPSLLTPWLADRRVTSAYDALESNRTAAAIDRADQARSLDPLSVEPLFAEALAKEREGGSSRRCGCTFARPSMQPENRRTWYELGTFELGLTATAGRSSTSRARVNSIRTGPRRGPLKELRAERARSR